MFTSLENYVLIANVNCFTISAEALSCYKNTEKGNVAEDCGAQTGCIKKFYQKSKFIPKRKKV